MKTNLFIAALSLVVLAGCSSEDEVGTLVAKSDNAITFGTYVGKQTKASIMDDTQLKTSGFNVIATYTGTDTWASLSGDKAKAPNFMYNESITHAEATGWTYQNIQYWPNEQDEKGTLGKVTFFAYSPKIENTTKLSDKAVPGAPTITLTVPDDINNQIDLVADMITDLDKSTKTIDNQDVAPGTVKFKMDHLLSQIEFQAKLKKQYKTATITVTEFKLAFKASTIKNQGTYTFNTDNTNNSIWELSTETYHSVNIDTKDLNKTLNNDASPAATEILSPMFLLPQTYTLGDITATISYTVSNNGSTVNNVKKVELPALTGGWKPNKKYLYTFDIELTDVTVGVASAEWESESPQM